MCGLFGTHKSHKITTNTELRNLNNNIAKKTQESLKEIADLKILRRCDSFQQYLDMKVKSKLLSYKKTVAGVYEVGL